MEIPVYVFTGFLESGKTKMVHETMADKRFQNKERTLIILCEEGIEEYDVSEYSGEVFLETVEAPRRSQPKISRLCLKNIRLKE